jgi:hypothetical protein
MSKRYYTKVIGGNSLPSAPTGINSQPRIKIEQNLGYRGYFWHIEEFVSIHKSIPKDWHKVGRGGYALTFWGAKFAGKKEMKKRKNFKSQNREWIIEA